MLPLDYDGDLDILCWMGMYAPVLLGEHQKIDATLHGVYFFRFLTSLKTSYIVNSEGNYLAGELAMPSEGYFLAGRGLSWWLIGFSLIAANISTEQFVGMSGQAADYVGLAIASYEWMAAITLVVVAFFFLPTFLRSGIYTIPEFLEYRYDRLARTVMSQMSPMRRFQTWPA